MYARRHYGFWKLFNWSKKPFILSTLYAAFITMAHKKGLTNLSPFLLMSIGAKNT